MDGSSARHICCTATSRHQSGGLPCTARNLAFLAPVGGRLPDRARKQAVTLEALMRAGSACCALDARLTNRTAIPPSGAGFWLERAQGARVPQRADLTIGFRGEVGGV
eukprot:5222779-Prymnesium_polylepis.1